MLIRDASERADDQRGGARGDPLLGAGLTRLFFGENSTLLLPCELDLRLPVEPRLRLSLRAGFAQVLVSPQRFPGQPDNIAGHDHLSTTRSGATGAVTNGMRAARARSSKASEMNRE